MNVVSVVVSRWIFTCESVSECPFWNGSPDESVSECPVWEGSPERHATARGRPIVPRPPPRAAVGVAGDRTGPNAKLGERGASKGAVPGPRYGGGS